jgi:hypothetical protein
VSDPIEHPSDEAEARPKSAIWRNLVRLAAICLAAYLLHLLFDWARAEALIAKQGSMGLPVWAVLALLAAYALLIAIPFVPDVEIGLTLLMIGGAWVSPAVYGATVLGLAIAYGVGALLPDRALRALFQDLRMHSVVVAIDRLAPLTPQERLDRLTAQLPGWLAPVASRYRYVTLAILINTPGNMLLGGGGGLLMLAGLSRLFAPVPTLLTLLVAVAPVPLLFVLFGWNFAD